MIPCLTEIPSYVIYCKEIGRKELTRKHLNAHGIYPEFFRGVHGKTFALGSTRVHGKTKEGKDWVITPGHASLVLNHLFLYQHCLMNDLDHVVILEDDVFVTQNAIEEFDKMRRILPRSYDVVYLGWLHEGHDRKLGHYNGILHNKINDCIFGTHAMLYSRAGLEKAIRPLYRGWNNIDILIYEHCLPNMEWYVCYPCLFNQRSQNKQGKDGYKAVFANSIS